MFAGIKTALSIVARCAMYAAGVLLLTGKVSAEEERIDSIDAAPSSDESAAQLQEDRPRVRISIGPQWVQSGEARYAQRSTVGGNATVVVFSRSPAPAFAGARSGALLPAGLPVSARLTSGFGMRAHPIRGGMRNHSGVDLAAPYGSPIVATADGVIGTAGWSGGYGLLISISHGDGVQTRYGHLSRLNVAAGQQVRRGDVIGFVGSTGQSTGPHVHYEVRVNGVATDPLGG